ncbi:right-handed parallel beta-helix repeat-containing protein [Blastopirellula sp. JC732]|uniref:Right-handed parallel beta-helix repeat-containing protein n=1 Tax=Blastopirellula sediminis TaxID=2894196 RepID=A0A9X1MQV6_9BACT|nr:right-handed parallel beta-helix repeat-containing protein [Blastopirellula sediminis]MCC9606320.1 right-handed parallel beta-helix repeat-containing protein [Blastopirellula sediminis]MCC9630382.1 right-handed parallel beta-helix repeat-containing protein [Blastopirellula sediminis]
MLQPIKSLLSASLLLFLLTSFAVAESTVRDFGAKGDGVTDDTAAIQKMVDSGAQSIRFPAGVYRITGTISIDLDHAGPVAISGDGTATIKMEAAGPAIRVIGTHGGTADPKSVKPNVWEKQRTPMIDGLEIVGAHNEAIGVEINGAMQPTLTRLAVRKCLHGVVLTGRNRNVLVGECHLYENSGIGLYLSDLNLHQINIANSHISYNKAGGIVVRNSEIRNLHIGTCDIEANMSLEHPEAANVLFDVTAGSVREAAIVGCTIQHSSVPDCANVRLVGQPDLPHKVGHVTIADNVMCDVAYNIDMKHARSVTIVGNTLFRAIDACIQAENCSNLVIGANVMDRIKDYGPADTNNSVRLIDCRDSTIQGLHMNGDADPMAAITLKNCSRITVRDCTILDGKKYALWIDGGEKIRVTDCLFDGQGEKFPVHQTGNRVDVRIDDDSLN